METVTSTGATFKQQSTGGYWFWTVTTNNIVGVNQLYQVEDILTPFGKITDVAVAIPADVIQAMADSINQLQQQFAPLLALVQPYSTNVSFIVTEGDPNINVTTIPVQNVGAFGSFMTVTASPSVSWLMISPPSIAGMGKGEQGQLAVQLLPASLLSSGSPYSSYINVQDNRNPPTLIPVNFNITVLPRPVIATTPTAIGLSFSLISMSPSGSQQLVVTNAGPVNSVLNFTAAKLLNNSRWLDFTPTSGGPLNPAQSTIITLSVIPVGVPTIQGTYTETLRILSTNASNSPIDIPVSLTVI
jgi:hypothetical protein